MRKVVVIATLAVAAGLLVVFLSASDRAAPVGRDAGDGAGGARAIADAGTSSGRKSRVARESSRLADRRRAKAEQEDSADWTLDDFDDEDHPYSKEDKQVALELQVSLDALDEFDEKDVAAAERSKARGERVDRPEVLRAKERFSAAAAKAAASANPAVRKEAIDAYSWRGGESLPELTPMMADPDGEVAEEAIDAVQSALDELENPNLRFEAAAAYVSTFSVNEDALDMLSGTMVSSALEIIDADGDSAEAEQKALDNRALVVDTLATIIENGQGKSVDTAKEAYSDITSEDWISRAEADKWALDPDNYEAPEM